MDQAALRGLIGQLAEDLAWLEEHARAQPEQAGQAGAVRLAAALVRNVIGPYLEGQAPAPLHVAVVGGAGAGKSTVANFLCGSVVTETNPQAGFTRHPVAFTGDGQAGWGAHVGFLGPLRRLGQASSASLDADVYQVRRVPLDGDAFGLMPTYVVWDCPDMTTWAATHYVPRLLEVAGLADVLVYVASDERYNDEVPTQFLKLLLQAGKAVVVVLVKMKEQDAATFVQHFQKEVLAKMPVRAVSCLTIPQLTAAQLADPAKEAPNFRIPLINQVDVLGKPPAAARKRSVQSAVHFLKHGQETLLSVARADLAALNTWRNLVQEGQLDFQDRYRREYLSAEQFHRFDEALVRLLELLELPGVGKVLSTALYVVRTPYRLLKSLFTRGFRRPAAPTLPERPILDAALGGWLDLLRKETARRSATHPLWTHIHRGFATGLADQASQRFEEGFRAFQLSQAEEVERTAKAIYEDLERHPAALNTLRGTKFALEVGAIAGSVFTVGVWGLVIGPLAASITHQLIELLGSQYVDSRREQARTRQQALVVDHLSGPMAEWLTNWPSTGGSAFERLQLALRRVPQDIQQLERAVQERLKGTAS